MTTKPGNQTRTMQTAVGGAESEATGMAWPLRSYLAFGAFPSAVSCARLHARQIVWEWGLGHIAATVELIVSELATNAVKASNGMASATPSHGDAARLNCIAMFLASDGERVLIKVWDASPEPPVRAAADQYSEGGRGLLLVETMCEQWEWYTAQKGWAGKWVWAVVSGAAHDRTGEHHEREASVMR